jgi:hypothetical protein
MFPSRHTCIVIDLLPLCNLSNCVWCPLVIVCVQLKSHPPHQSFRLRASMICLAYPSRIILQAPTSHANKDATSVAITSIS